MRSSQRVTKMVRRRGTSDAILLLSLVMIVGVVVSNFLVGNQVAFNNSAVHIEVTDKGIAIHPTITDQSHDLAFIKKNVAADINQEENHEHSGAEITKFLTGEQPFPTDCKEGGRCRLKFIPGTLQLSSAQTLQQCYVDADKYKAHIKSTKHLVTASISHKHKIIYHNIPKSASSTSRHAMFDYLEGKDYGLPFDTMMKLVTNHNYTMISFIREPLTRFYSSYDEAYFRMGPWMGEGELVEKQPNLRQHYQSVKYKVDKYPYLYEGMKDINDFRQFYCPTDVLDTGEFLKCDDHDSIDDGRLLTRFEQFVQDYDGLEPFDVHLNMQTTNLIYEAGKPLPIHTLYNASEAEKDWQEISRQRGVTIPDGEMKHGRHQSRRFDVSKVSETTQQKICRILALDYCCLNFELPEVCNDVGLYCSLEQMEGKRISWKQDDSLNLVIRPWQTH